MKVSKELRDIKIPRKNIIKLIGLGLVDRNSIASDNEIFVDRKDMSFILCKKITEVSPIEVLCKDWVHISLGDIDALEKAFEPIKKEEEDKHEVVCDNVENSEDDLQCDSVEGPVADVKEEEPAEEPVEEEAPEESVEEETEEVEPVEEETDTNPHDNYLRDENGDIFVDSEGNPITINAFVDNKDNVTAVEYIEGCKEIAEEEETPVVAAEPVVFDKTPVQVPKKKRHKH